MELDIETNSRPDMIMYQSTLILLHCISSQQNVSVKRSPCMGDPGFHLGGGGGGKCLGHRQVVCLCIVLCTTWNIYVQLGAGLVTIDSMVTCLYQ